MLGITVELGTGLEVVLVGAWIFLSAWVAWKGVKVHIQDDDKD